MSKGSANEKFLHFLNSMTFFRSLCEPLLGGRKFLLSTLTEELRDLLQVVCLTELHIFALLADLSVSANCCVKYFFFAILVRFFWLANFFIWQISQVSLFFFSRILHAFCLFDWFMLLTASFHFSMGTPSFSTRQIKTLIKHLL